MRFLHDNKPVSLTAVPGNEIYLFVFSKNENKTKIHKIKSFFLLAKCVSKLIPTNLQRKLTVFVKVGAPKLFASFASNHAVEEHVWQQIDDFRERRTHFRFVVLCKTWRCEVKRALLNEWDERDLPSSARWVVWQGRAHSWPCPDVVVWSTRRDENRWNWWILDTVPVVGRKHEEKKALQFFSSIFWNCFRFVSRLTWQENNSQTHKPNE